LLASCQTTEQTSQDADPVIADALSQVSIDSVKVYIDDLVVSYAPYIK
jgi:hypothetical protein